MYWDRFDICEAYYLYMMNYHGGQWSKEDRLTGVFAAIQFRPSPMLGCEDFPLSENAQMIYDSLVSGETEIRDRR